MSERLLATGRSPDLVTTTILIEGEQIPRTCKVSQVVVDREVNRVPTARLVLLDGDPATEDFPLSNQGLFVPGKTIAIQAGYHSEEETIFEGLIVKHSIKLRANGNAALLLECKDKAVRLTQGRKSRYFYEMKDSQVFEEILGGYDLQASVDDTGEPHREIVQFQATDWDFIMTRSELCGLLCFVDDGKLALAKPALDEEPVAELIYGATIIDVDAEIDARWQQNNVVAQSWDPAGQESLSVEGEAPGLQLNGNLSPADLAAVASPETCELAHGGLLKEFELQHWANARWLRAELAKVRGSVKFAGLPQVRPGVFINLQGIGERFSGKAYVTGIRHAIYDGDWKTHAQFGLDPAWFSEKYPVHQQPAAGLLPAISGLHIGLVTRLGEDPEGEERILVRLPVINPEEQGVWARVAVPDAGTDRTVHFRPEIGDEVLVGFLHDDPRHPVVLGALHSSDKPSPIATTDDNHEKGIVTRSQLKIIFNDDTKTLTVETPGGRKITLNDDGGEMMLEDGDGNKCTLDSGGITLETSGDLTLKATGDLNLEGNNVNVKANAQFKAEGAAGAEVSSSGTAVLKGSLVQIN